METSTEEAFAARALSEARNLELNLVEVIQKMKLLLTLDVTKEIESLQKQIDDLRSIQMRLNRV